MSDSQSKPSGALRSRVLKAGAWTLGSTVGVQVLRLAGNLVASRFLDPSMYGVMAIVFATTMILSLLSDVGIHQLVVRHPRGHEPRFLDTLWTVKILRGAALGVATALVGVALVWMGQRGMLPADSAYASPVLPAVMGVMALEMLLIGAFSTKLDCAVRDLQMHRYAILQLVQQVVAVTVVIGLAWWTRSIWALVFGSMAGSLVQLIMSHRALPGHRHRLDWDREVLKELKSFGGWVLLSSAIGVLAMQADRLLLGGAADARFLGLYAMAINLSGALGMVFERLIGQVAFPSLAEVSRRDPKALVDAYWKARWRADPVMLIASGSLFVLGPMVISVLYDDRYAQAGPILSLLALSLLFSRYYLLQQVYMVLDRMPYVVMLNVLSLVATLAAVPIGVHWNGAMGAVAVLALRAAINLPAWYYFNQRHGLNRLGQELLLLGFWPLGWLLGQAALWLARTLGSAA
jgi:O-antigen/teichoic acid export membrane protein